MARRGRRGGSRGRSFGTSKDPLDAFLAGVGTAAMSKRFVGELPIVGKFTGTAAAGGYAYLKRKNILAALAGGAVHDFVGNVPASGGVTGGAYGTNAY